MISHHVATIIIAVINAIDVLGIFLCYGRKCDNFVFFGGNGSVREFKEHSNKNSASI